MNPYGGIGVLSIQPVEIGGQVWATHPTTGVQWCFSSLERLWTFFNG